MSYGWLRSSNEGTVKIFENENVPRTHDHFSVHRIPGSILESEDFGYFTIKFIWFSY